MTIVRALMEQQIDFDEDLAERFFRCSTCGMCKQVCPAEIDTLKVYETIRHELVRRNLATDAHQRIIEKAKEFGSPYGQSRVDRAAWAKNLQLQSKGDIVYFVGCTDSYISPQVPQATMKTLQRIGVNPTVLGSQEQCCGSPLLRTGWREPFMELVEANVKAFRKIGSQRIVTSCPGCFRTLAEDYPKVSDQFDFQVMHIVQLLLEQLDKGKLEFKNGVNITVTYHDPCHLARHMGVVEAPRKILEAVPRLSLVEMRRNRLNAYCCGAGGGMMAAFRDFTINIAENRIREAEETGANALVTACPFCEHALKEACKGLNSSLTVYDIIDVVSMALG